MAACWIHGHRGARCPRSDRWLHAGWPSPPDGDTVASSHSRVQGLRLVQRLPMAPSSSTRPSSSRRGHSAAQSPRCHLPTVPASLSHTSARLRAVEDLCSSFSWTPAQLQSIGFTDHEIRQGRLSCTKVGVLPAVPGKLSPQQLRQHAMRDACSVTYWSALQLQDLGVFSRKDLEEVGFFTPPCFRPLPRPLTAR